MLTGCYCFQVFLTDTSAILLRPSSEHVLYHQDRRSEPEAESHDILHAVSIPAYDVHRWKEDSCSPNLDGDLAQGANRI